MKMSCVPGDGRARDRARGMTGRRGNGWIKKRYSRSASPLTVKIAGQEQEREQG